MSKRNWLSRFVRESLCRHRWQSSLIFSPGPKTHHEVVRCVKCGKHETTFSGTRGEWNERHELEFLNAEISDE